MASAQSSFAQTLERGLLGESEIAKWLMSRGGTILPAYQIEIDEGKGPRVFRAHGNLVAPDMLTINSGKDVAWIEAKTKGGWTWFRGAKSWQDGIDKNHWLDYVQVDQELPWPVHILFLHKERKGAKDSPQDKIPPSAGLYGNSVNRLADCIDHTSDKHGNHGMVYWNRSALKRYSGYPL